MKCLQHQRQSAGVGGELDISANAEPRYNELDEVQMYADIGDLVGDSDYSQLDAFTEDPTTPPDANPTQSYVHCIF